jgi:hypothetical protein
VSIRGYHLAETKAVEMRSQDQLAEGKLSRHPPDFLVAAFINWPKKLFWPAIFGDKYFYNILKTNRL